MPAAPSAPHQPAPSHDDTPGHPANADGDPSGIPGVAEVRHSTIHGRGVFALRPLARGQRIGQYTGRRIGPDESIDDCDNALTYLFGLSDGSTIDGRDGGNATRYINHACEPNCEAVEHEAPDGELFIVIEARRRIGVGEELFIDYSLDAGPGDPADFPCHCRATRCRGTMLARRRSRRRPAPTETPAAQDA